MGDPFTWLLPLLFTGLVNPNCTNFIGNGVVVHVPSFFDELEALQAKGEAGAGNGCSEVHKVCTVASFPPPRGRPPRFRREI